MNKPYEMQYAWPGDVVSAGMWQQQPLIPMGYHLRFVSNIIIAL